MSKSAEEVLLKKKKASTKRMPRLIEHNFRAKRSMWIWGAMAVAKSAIVKATATARGVAFCDIRLPNMDPTDLRGMAYKIEENGCVIGVSWTPPLQLPKDIDFERVISIEAAPTRIRFERMNPVSDNGIRHCQELDITVETFEDGLTAEIVEESLSEFTVKIVDANGKLRPGTLRYSIKGEAKAIVAFEEMNLAVKAVQDSCYQIALDRKIAEYVAGDGIQFIALGNREEDYANVEEVSMPLLNRFNHYEQTMKPSEWVDWAITEQVEPDIIGFIQENTAALNHPAPKPTMKSINTSRTWHSLSDIIVNNPGMDREDEEFHILASVGEAHALEFIEHRKSSHLLPKNEDVLNGTVKRMPGGQQETSLVMTLATRLCFALKERNDELVERGIKPNDTGPERTQWFEQADNFLSFIQESARAEIGVTVLKNSIRQHALPFSTRRMKHFASFSEKYAPFLTSRETV